jgi:hypothetical protein
MTVAAGAACGAAAGTKISVIGTKRGACTAADWVAMAACTDAGGVIGM